MFLNTIRRPEWLYCVTDYWQRKMWWPLWLWKRTRKLKKKIPHKCSWGFESYNVDFAVGPKSSETPTNSLLDMFLLDLLTFLYFYDYLLPPFFCARKSSQTAQQASTTTIDQGAVSDDLRTRRSSSLDSLSLSLSLFLKSTTLLFFFLACVLLRFSRKIRYMEDTCSICIKR